MRTLCVCVWLLQVIHGHTMPLTAVVPFTMMVTLHFAVVAPTVLAYYGVLYFAGAYAAPALLAMMS